MRIAVIGSGIAGLAASYYLSRKHEVSLFDKDGRLGGHTNTALVETGSGRTIPVDTGFIVHNDHTYPNLMKLLKELGVETQPSDMSFSVTNRQSGFEYSSHGVNGFFAQRSNLFRPAHYLLLNEILRFNCTAPQMLNHPKAAAMTIGDLIDEGRYHSVFTEHYLYPMSAAVWSMSLDSIRSFPAFTLLRFFENHGLLQLNNHFVWKVIRGGSNTYIPLLSAPFKDRIHTGVLVASVSRLETGVTLNFADRPAMAFDQVVLACHGDQALPLLEKPTDAERDVMGSFKTSTNVATLHTDRTLLPRRKRAWASWNYNLGMTASTAATVTYHMNRLQSLNDPLEYCVTLNGESAIDAAKVLRRIVYHHPLYTQEAVRAQGRWSEISGQNRTHFCGAYWFYGFHEDGLNSALRVARALSVEC
jgi:predicted NAD/FAD-binding protein